MRRSNAIVALLAFQGAQADITASEFVVIGGLRRIPAPLQWVAVRDGRVPLPEVLRMHQACSCLTSYCSTRPEVC